MLEVIKNATTGDMEETHILEIPPCCPVSKNPRPGSQLIISYRPIGQSLEIGSLLAYIHSYQGGKRDTENNLLVRDMEGMIRQISIDLQQLLQIPVSVKAELYLLPKQIMYLAIS